MCSTNFFSLDFQISVMRVLTIIPLVLYPKYSSEKKNEKITQFKRWCINNYKGYLQLPIKTCYFCDITCYSYYCNHMKIQLCLITKTKGVDTYEETTIWKWLFPKKRNIHILASVKWNNEETTIQLIFEFDAIAFMSLHFQVWRL